MGELLIVNQLGPELSLSQSDFGEFLRAERAGGGRIVLEKKRIEHDQERAKKLGVFPDVLSRLKVDMPRRFPMVSTWINDRERRWREVDYVAVGAYLERYRGTMSAFPIEKAGDDLNFLAKGRFRLGKELASDLIISGSTWAELSSCLSDEVKDRMLRDVSRRTKKPRPATVYPDEFVKKIAVLMAADVGVDPLRKSGNWWRKHREVVEKVLMREVEKIDKMFEEWLEENCGFSEAKQEKRLDLGSIVDIEHLDEAELYLERIRKKTEESRIEYEESDLDLVIRQGCYQGEENIYLLTGEDEMVLGWWVEQGLRLGSVEKNGCKRTGEMERVEVGVALARDIFFKTNRSLIWSRVSYLWGKGVRVEWNDMFQSGCLGLLRASEDYDWRKGRFSTYATYWIDSYIRRESGRMSVALNFPDHLLSVPKERWSDRDRILSRVVEIDSLEPGVESRVLVVADNSAEEATTRVDSETLWEEMMNCFCEKKINAKVVETMRLYYFKGYSVREVAIELRVSFQSVRNYLKKGERAVNGILKR